MKVVKLVFTPFEAGQILLTAALEQGRIRRPPNMKKCDGNLIWKDGLIILELEIEEK